MILENRQIVEGAVRGRCAPKSAVFSRVLFQTLLPRFYFLFAR